MMMAFGDKGKKDKKVKEEGVPHSQRFFDLTAEITSKTVVHPGDPSFLSELATRTVNFNTLAGVVFGDALRLKGRQLVWAFGLSGWLEIG
ncbi:MAG: hypothetical protein JJT82_02100 [Legionellaceae bacterium]|nr:hypothetical protein [Legionellaceae bacterium]